MEWREPDGRHQPHQETNHKDLEHPPQACVPASAQAGPTAAADKAGCACCAQDGAGQAADRAEVVACLVDRAIEGLSSAQLDLALSSNSWTIRQLIHHIADGDYLWKEFLLRAAGDPEREFSLEWYWCLPQDEWVKRWSYAGREVAHSLELFTANRQHTLDLLTEIPWLWEKSLLIPTREGGQERVTVADVVEMQSRHAEGHAEDIHQIRLAHGV